MKYNEAFSDDKSPYLKSIELLGEEAITAITGVKREEIYDPTSDKDREGLVVHLYGMKKFICNKTNFKTISIIAGSANTDDWVGKVIILYAKVGKFFGVEGTAIRVKPKPEPILRFLEGATSIDDLKGRFSAIGERASVEEVKKLSQKLKKQ